MSSRKTAAAGDRSWLGMIAVASVVLAGFLLTGCSAQDQQAEAAWRQIDLEQGLSGSSPWRYCDLRNGKPKTPESARDFRLTAEENGFLLSQEEATDWLDTVCTYRWWREIG